MKDEDKIRGFGPLPKIISYIPDEELAYINWDKIPNLSKYYGKSILITTPPIKDGFYDKCVKMLEGPKA